MREQRRFWPSFEGNKLRTTRGLFIIAVVTAGCSAKDTSAPVNTTTPIVIAHRGASAYAPEHTIPAYDLAVAQGADYLELDVQRTSDGVLVVVHDSTLDRTARGSAGNCIGRILEKTLAQIQTCDVGSWFNDANPEIAKPQFVGLRIPTLSDVIGRYGTTSRLYIETKDPDLYPGIESDLVALLNKSGIVPGATKPPRVFIESFSEASLRKVHSLNSALPLIQLIGAVAPATVIAQLNNIRTYAVGIGPVKEDVTSAVVAAAHASCLVVHPYTVDSSDEIQSLLALGVDGMFTDSPDLLREFVDSSPSRTAGATGCT